MVCNRRLSVTEPRDGSDAGVWSSRDAAETTVGIDEAGVGVATGGDAAGGDKCL
jgi:hypothetical protein